MNLIDDPSIVPIVTTDLEGNILFVRTNGLHYYGFHDFIMEDNFENYEEIFDLFLKRALNLSFDYSREWPVNGKFFRTKIREDGLAHIYPIDTENKVQIVTIYHPIKDTALRHQSIGLQALYGHPDFIINASVEESYHTISFAISEVKKGAVCDENIYITCAGKTFDIALTTDRYGNKIYEIIERE